MKSILLLLALLPLLACETTPAETDCVRGQNGEIDCAPSADTQWSDDALQEAEEGFDERGPDDR